MLSVVLCYTPAVVMIRLRCYFFKVVKNALCPFQGLFFLKGEVFLISFFEYRFVVKIEVVYKLAFADQQRFYPRIFACWEFDDEIFGIRSEKLSRFFKRHMPESVM